eukprot:3199026-Rhodomonas_salina.2
MLGVSATRRVVPAGGEATAAVTAGLLLAHVGACYPLSVSTANVLCDRPTSALRMFLYCYACAAPARSQYSRRAVGRTTVWGMRRRIE